MRETYLPYCRARKLERKNGKTGKDAGIHLTLPQFLGVALSSKNDLDGFGRSGRFRQGVSVFTLCLAGPISGYSPVRLIARFRGLSALSGLQARRLMSPGARWPAVGGSWAGGPTGLCGGRVAGFRYDFVWVKEPAFPRLTYRLTLLKWIKIR